jgi:D-alanyl-D-alanine carboxypeptidase
MGKGDITGYAYEPWHIRYVGKGLANYLYTNDLTLDEYYKYTPSSDFDFESKYASLINYKPPKATITPVPSEGVIIGEDGTDQEGSEDGTVSVSPTVNPADSGDGDTIPVTGVPGDSNPVTPVPSLSPTPSPTPGATPVPAPTGGANPS